MIKKIKQTLKLVFSSNLVVFFLLGITSPLILNKDRMVAEFLDYSKEYGDYVNLFATNRAKLERKKMEKAFVYYEALAKYVAKDGLIKTNQGFCLYYLNRLDEAAQYYNEAIEQFPQLYMFYQDLGRIYAAKGDFLKANDYYHRAMNILIPDNDVFTQLIAEVKGQDASRRFFYDDTRLLEYILKYDKQQIYSLVIDSAKKISDYEQVRAVAYMGLKKYPSDLKLLYEAGLASLKVQKFKEAIVLFGFMLEKDPRDVRAYRHRAEGYRSLGLMDLAEKDERAAELYEDIPIKSVEKPFADMHMFYDRGLFFSLLSF